MTITSIEIAWAHGRERDDSVQRGLERLESPILTYPRSLWSDAAARPWGHRFLDSSCRVSASVVPKMSSERVEGAVPSSAAQGDYPGRGAPLCSAAALRQLVRHPNRRGVSSIECKPDGSVVFTFHGAGNSHRGLSKTPRPRVSAVLTDLSKTVLRRKFRRLRACFYKYSMVPARILWGRRLLSALCAFSLADLTISNPATMKTRTSKRPLTRSQAGSTEES